jgi:phage tail sheath protein FI
MSQGLTIETTLPGVMAIVNAASVARPVQRQPSSTFFVVGYSAWGPVNVPTVVTSWAEYLRTFGPLDANSFMDDALYAFFNLFAGKQAVVCRIVGASATKGTVSLNDRAGTPQPTLRIDAKYPSTRVDIRYTVEDGTDANTFKLTVRSLLIPNSKETWDNLKMDATSIAFVNQRSNLVQLTDLVSATAAPANRPANVAETLLPAGDDQFSSLAASDYIGTDSGSAKTGLQTFKDEQLGTGQVAIPGLTTTPVHAALVAHAESYHRLALLDPPLGSSKTDVTAIRALYGTWNGAIYYPWVKMLSFDGDGLTKFYPPSGFAAGACARADVRFGTHRAPAGLDFKIPGALDVERTASGQAQIDDGVREYLNGRDVNVIAPFANTGVLIYGARVMTADRRVQMVHEIRLLNLFYYSARLAYLFAVFSVVDGGGKLFRDLVSTGKNFLRSFYEDGALYGAQEADAFVVVADSSNNPPQQIDAGRVHVQWGVKLSPAAEIIIVNIDNVRLFQDLSVLSE